MREQSSPVDYVDFGRYLRQQRELRGLSLKEVATNTKISPALLGALEEGLRERLPERVFVLNYIRSYASAVGLSADDAVSRFEEMPEAPQQEHFDPAALEVARRKKAWMTFSVLLALLGISAAVLLFKAIYDLMLKLDSLGRL